MLWYSFESSRRAEKFQFFSKIQIFQKLNFFQIFLLKKLLKNSRKKPQKITKIHLFRTPVIFGSRASFLNFLSIKLAPTTFFINNPISHEYAIFIQKFPNLNPARFVLLEKFYVKISSMYFYFSFLAISNIFFVLQECSMVQNLKPFPASFLSVILVLFYGVSYQEHDIDIIL
jgi:hypothetical protein